MTTATGRVPALNPRFIEVVVAAIYLLACLLVLPDIPASWDELGNRNHGEIGIELARNYLATGEPAEQRFLHEHGTAVEMLLIGVERLIGGDFETDPAGALRIRHVAIFAIFASAVFAFYSFLRELLSSRLAGLLGSALFALHPRIFHHAFHNSSDIGFMSFTVLWIWTLQRLCRKPSVPSACLHGLFCALATDTRVVGIFFLAVSTVALGSNALATRLHRRNDTGGRAETGQPSVMTKRLVALVSVVASTSIFGVLLWPFLWGRPIGNLLWAVSQFSRFDVPFKIRYLGQLIWSTEVPWHYNPVWILITTPWYVIAGLIIAVLASMKRLTAPRELLRNLDPTDLAIVIAVVLWILVPLGAPMALGSTLFNGWRHHYFVYPAIVVASTWGLLLFVRWLGEFVRRDRSTEHLLLVVIALVITHLAATLGGLHPYQNLYFSSPLMHFFGTQRGNHHVFEVDYWCTSYREGLSHLALTTEGPVNVYGHWKPLWLNRLWLSPEDRQRIRIVRNIREADVYLGVFRHTPSEGYPRSFGREAFAIHIEDTQILSLRVLRLPPFGLPAKSSLPQSPSEVRRLIARTWRRTDD